MNPAKHLFHCVFVFTPLFLFSLTVVQTASAEEAYQVTAKAWDALAKKDWDSAVRLADQATNTWGGQAKATNNGLTALPKGDAVKKFANLNNILTLLISMCCKCVAKSMCCNLDVLRNFSPLLNSNQSSLDLPDFILKTLDASNFRPFCKF